MPSVQISPKCVKKIIYNLERFCKGIRCLLLRKCDSRTCGGNYDRMDKKGKNMSKQTATDLLETIDIRGKHIYNENSFQKKKKDGNDFWNKK